MIMCFVAVERRNFIKEQLSRSISNGQPGLPN
jgi:hypothetical protein